jgi:hypothetical protein
VPNLDVIYTKTSLPQNKTSKARVIKIC